MVGLINALIIKSVKATNFGNKLTEDMAGAEIGVCSPSVSKFGAVLVIFPLTHKAVRTLPSTLCCLLAISEA